MKRYGKAILSRQEANEPPEQIQISAVDEKKDKKIARIIGEIKEKRERNVKHFLKEDLTFEAAIYNDAVHYYSDGEWKNIDNSIVGGKDDDGNDVLENKDNSIKIKIAKKVKNKKLITIKMDKYEVSWGIEKAASSNAKVKDNTRSNSKEKSELKDSHRHEREKYRQTKAETLQAENQIVQEENLTKKTLKNLSSTTQFSDVFPNTDLEYTITSSKLKERLIIKAIMANPVYTFNMEVKNLLPVLQEDSSVIFYDDKDNTLKVFKIDPPSMYDAKDEVSKDIKVNLVKDNKGYTLTWTPDNGWLQNKNRSYPVTIDPTITTPTDTNAIIDSFASENNPNGTAAVYNYLRVGKDSIGNRFTSFIKFTLPVEKLTAADLITKAYLYLYEYGGNYTSLQINAHKVLESWTSGSVTWNYQPSIDESRIEDYQTLPISAGADFYLDITTMVKSWFLLGDNFGVALKGDDSSTGYVDFISSDSDSYYTNVRPQIGIQYVNNTGLESYWTYHSQDVQRAGTGYINDFNGNLVFVHNNLSMSGSRMPLTLNHVFNSSEKDKNAFGNQESTLSNYGYGWRLNLSQRVDNVTIGDNQYCVYTDEDGTKHYFLYDSTTSKYTQEMDINLY